MVDLTTFLENNVYVPFAIKPKMKINISFYLFVHTIVILGHGLVLNLYLFVPLQRRKEFATLNNY